MEELKDAPTFLTAGRDDVFDWTSKCFFIFSENEIPGDPPVWVDIYAGYATVTSDITVGMPNSAAVRQNFPSSFFCRRSSLAQGL